MPLLECGKQATAGWVTSACNAAKFIARQAATEAGRIANPTYDKNLRDGDSFSRAIL